MRKARNGSLLLVGMAMTIAMTGCGGVATTVDPSVVQTASQLNVPTSNSVVSMAVPTPAPTPMPRIDATLTATISNFQKAFLGLGKSTATVQITNSSPIALIGTLTVSFTDSGTVKGAPQTQSVTVPPFSSQTQAFSDSSWFLDGATASIVTLNGGVDGGSGGVY